jgi:hypothetical protein
MKKYFLLALLLALAACETPLQRPDDKFDAAVAKPAFGATDSPLLLFDAAHHNFHRSDGLYGPFARLARNDGFAIRDLDGVITREALAPARILLLAGARSEGDANDQAAFTSTETEAIAGWVQGGGSLLLIADHYPFGPAVSALAARFGVQLSPGMVEDSLHYDRPSEDRSQLLFSRANGLLADGPLTRGVDRVVTFTGTSLRGPANSDNFLRLSASAFDLQPNVQVQKDGADSRVTVTYDRPVSAAGRAQGLAFSSGKGRVLVLGEAAMLSAQLSRDDKAVGMNYNAGNKRLALNILEWLAGK